jgi:hypothetical protein
MSLFALQVAPLGVKVDSAGRFSISIGGGGGRYEETSTDCAGNVLERQKLKYGVVGAEAEAWVAPNIRIVGHAGKMSSDSLEGPRVAADFEGFFGGIMGAYEGETKGVGVGLSVQPTGDAGTIIGGSRNIVPMFYARIGRSEKVHIRIESGSPAAPGAPPAIVRFAIARGMGPPRQVAFSVGLGLAAFPDDASLPLDAMVRVPVGKSFDLGVSTGFRDPHGFNLGVFGRVNFGQPARP